MQCIIPSKIINYYKWEALINFLREKKEKTHRREKRNERNAFAGPSLELSPFMLSQLFNTVYQRIDLT